METKRYFLCSKAVIDHFPDLEKSKPFKSGYKWDTDEYYVIATCDFDTLNRYYKKVIEPFNEKSRIADIDFWLREACSSLLVDFKITQKQCKSLGVFVAIEQELNLTNEKNRAFAIHRMAEVYGLTPLEFINKVA